MGGRWLLYFHTVRQLKPSQVFRRAWHRLPVVAAPGAGLRRLLIRSHARLAGDSRPVAGRDAQGGIVGC